jgi:hypothetical protein
MSLPFASLELSGAASRAAGQPGAAGAIIVASSSRYFGLSGQLTLQSPRYDDLSLLPATARPTAQGRLTISTSLAQRV